MNNIEWKQIMPNNMPTEGKDILVSMLNLETGHEFIEVGKFVDNGYECYSACGDGNVIPIAYSEIPKCFLESKGLNSVAVTEALNLIENAR